MTTPLHPLVPEVGVLSVGRHPWGPHWLTPRHVATRLARYFNVVWLEPAHHWRETPSVFARRRAVETLDASIPSSFQVYVPEPWLPDLHRAGSLKRELFRRRLRNARVQLERRGYKRFVLYLWRPEFDQAMWERRHDLSLYHIDDEYSFQNDPPPMDGREARVIRAADHVLAISPGLMSRKGGINPNMCFAPEGVDYSLYATPVPEPDDLAAIPRPRIGYTGMLKQHVDWPKMRSLAERHVDWSFVFVGPRSSLSESDCAILDQMAGWKNVYFLGGKHVSALAAYPQHFDVCIMPYVVNGYTNNIYPLKLHEYLASGTPVVGTPIRSLQDFAEVVLLADSTDAWSGALADALNRPQTSVASRALRQATARRNDRSEIIYRVASLIGEGLGPEVATRPTKIDPI